MLSRQPRTVRRYDADARAVLDFLKTNAHCTGALGVMGICIGGHLAFRAAMNPDVLAATCFYATDIHKHGLGQGMNDNSLDRNPRDQRRVIDALGTPGSACAARGSLESQAALNAANTNFTWHEFNGAHAFCATRLPLRSQLALQCYRLALDLFRRKLGEGDTRVASTASGRRRRSTE